MPIDTLPIETAERLPGLERFFVETLASLVADMCLADSRVERVTVRAEKLDAIAEVSSVGIEIERRRGDAPEPRVRVIDR